MANFIRKTLSFLGLDEDEDEIYDTGDDNYSDYDRKSLKDVEKTENEREKSFERKVEPKTRRRTGYYNNELQDSNMRIFRSKRGNPHLHSIKNNKTRVFITEPHQFEEVQVIGDNFKQDIPVIVNLQKTNSDLSKRIIDFCSGITYALEGSIMKVADKVFLIIPHNVEVSSEEKELLKEKGLYNQF